MRIGDLLLTEETHLHIWSRHSVSEVEVYEVILGRHLIFRGRGTRIYDVFGRTEAGRYLTIIFRDLGRGAAKVITAREMNEAGRRRYDKHVAH